jgi:hypothetical protein
MSDAIITVSNLGKKYRIQHNAERQRYTALRDVIAEKAKSFFSRSQKSEVRSRKLKGSAGVSPASFGVSPKGTIKQSPGGTPAEGNRDGRAPKTSDHSSLVTPPKTSGPCATFPSRSNAGKWWELLAGTGRGRAPY